VSLRARSLAVRGRAAASLREAVRWPGWPLVYEGLYFTYLAYRMLANLLGIAVENLGTAWLAGLALLALPLGRARQRHSLPVVLAGLTAAAYVAVQVWVHRLPLTHLYVTIVLVWPVSVLVIEKCRRQPGFLARLAALMFLLLLAVWPTIHFELMAGDVPRASLRGTPIDNPNDLALWAGFCALVGWLWGLQQAPAWRRLAAWAIAAVAFAVMFQTVGRAALLALLLGVLLSLRRYAARRWPAILAALVTVAALILLLPPLRQAALGYVDRFDDSSERVVIWPLTVQAILERPLIGHGADEAEVFLAYPGRAYTPHNGILFFGLASGIGPMAGFTALWAAAAWSALRRHRRHPAGEPDALPLFVYALIAMLLFNFQFADPWAIAAVGCAFPSPAERRAASG
jgi:O-antigen ligase